MKDWNEYDAKHNANACEAGYENPDVSRGFLEWPLLEKGANVSASWPEIAGDLKQDQGDKCDSLASVHVLVDLSERHILEAILPATELKDDVRNSKVGVEFHVSKKDDLYKYWDLNTHEDVSL